MRRSAAFALRWRRRGRPLRKLWCRRGAAHGIWLRRALCLGNPWLCCAERCTFAGWCGRSKSFGPHTMCGVLLCRCRGRCCSGPGGTAPCREHHRWRLPRPQSCSGDPRRGSVRLRGASSLLLGRIVGHNGRLHCRLCRSAQHRRRSLLPQRLRHHGCLRCSLGGSRHDGGCSLHGQRLHREGLLRRLRRSRQGGRCGLLRWRLHHDRSLHCRLSRCRHDGRCGFLGRRLRCGRALRCGLGRRRRRGWCSLHARRLHRDGSLRCGLGRCRHDGRCRFHGQRLRREGFLHCGLG
mmetsp:Transcript_82030/g.244688  ORF Transcript_82030/g.244688 Transcript_82030/m.244688 type:complete len:293 (+) Transcript_82030:579-1457(+)